MYQEFNFIIFNSIYLLKFDCELLNFVDAILYLFYLDIYFMYV